ncbi:ABC transporter permease subunit [Halostagnicola bangensis]
MSVRSSIGALASRLREPFEGPNTIGNTNGFWIGFLLTVLLFAIYPILFGPYAALNPAQFLVFALLAVSLTFIWGFCGILSFGQVAFFGVAGYTFGIVTINIPTYTGATLGIIIAVAVATAFAAVIGYFMFYGGVRDVYVTILTLVVALVLHTFMEQTAGSQWTIGEAHLGGYNGMNVPQDLAVGFGETGVAFDGVAHYYVVLFTLVVTYLLLRAVVNSRFGYAMVATREDEARTEMFGYNTTFIKLAAFTVGGAIAGISGVLFVTWGAYINPSQFELVAATMPVIYASIGGRKSFAGTILAAVAIQYLELQLTGEWAFVIVGSLLVLIILTMPDGIAPRVRNLVLAVGEWRSNRDRSEQSPPAEEVSD